jgi:hypothetical protein
MKETDTFNVSWKSECYWYNHNAYKFVWLSYKCSVSVNDLKQLVTTAVASVDGYMLQCVRNELDYRIDICRVTKGSNTEHLYLTHTNYKTKYFSYINSILISIKRWICQFPWQQSSAKKNNISLEIHCATQIRRVWSVEVFLIYKSIRLSETPFLT